MTNDEKKKCPNCGAECDEGDLYCTKCNYKFDFGGKSDLSYEYKKKVDDYSTNTEKSNSDADNKYETKYEHEYSVPEEKADYSFSIILFIVICFVAGAVYLLSSHSSNSDTEKETTQALACDDDSIKQMVLDDFKSKNYYYRHINADTISSIDLIYANSTNYDETNNEYACKGVIVVKSTNGFKPSDNTLNNNYYSKIYQHNEDNGEEKLATYNKYEVPVEYTTAMDANNEPMITANYPSSQDCGEFSCSGNCNPVIITKAREEQPSSNYTNYNNYNDNNTINSQAINEQQVNNDYNDNQSFERDNVDFGPYMRDLQRRIKRNWHPPKGTESKKAVVLMKIGRSGNLLNCSIKNSSGDYPTDQAALDAVNQTTFKPLPADFKGQNVDIEFTFDYKVHSL